MKKYGTIFIIIAAFVGFCAFDIISRYGYKVLDIIDANTIVVDLNHNNIADENETVCIQDTKVFSDDYKKEQKAETDKYNISEETALTIGYLGQKFAQDVLLDRKIKIKFNGNRSDFCRYASININNKDYKTLLQNAGYEISSTNGITPEILKKAQKLNLVIYNHVSAKYHTTDCKYGKTAHDAVLIPKKDLPIDASPCKFCHIHKSNNKGAALIIPTIITSLNVKLYLTDFTAKLKPDTGCNSPMCKALLSEINMAEKSIDIAAYGWDDNKILNNAIKNAIKRGVKVRLVYETNTKNTSFYPYTFEFANWIKNARSDYMEGNFKETNYLMHNKFIVFDNKIVFTGSANFSFTGISGYNANAAFIINSKQIAQLYTDEFEQMYTGKFHLQKQKTKKNNRFIFNDKKISVFFMPQDKGITNGVIPLINNAKHYIYVPTFLITHKEMTSALIKAKKRGVDVKVIVDATNASNRSSTHQSLRDSGIPVKTENYAGKMHLKSVIIDDEYVVGGSMNFSYSGENKNDENMLLIEDKNLAFFYKNYFLYIWDKIPDKWLKYNARAESFDSIGSCFDGIDNDFDGKIDSDDEGCMKKQQK